MKMIRIFKNKTFQRYIENKQYSILRITDSLFLVVFEVKRATKVKYPFLYDRQLKSLYFLKKKSDFKEKSSIKNINLDNFKTYKIKTTIKTIELFEELIHKNCY